jgi:hypothetical protein
MGRGTVMTHQGLARTTPWVNPGKRKQGAWLVVGLAVTVAGTAIAATVELRHPIIAAGGDPGGVRQQALRSISVAVPSDANVQNHSAGGPIWESCDGRPDTQGWSDVINSYQFTSARSAATVVANVEASMKIAGWKRTTTSTSPLGPSVIWTKAVSGSVVAHATLSVGTSGPSRHSPSYWDFAASAPPAGTRASGC